MPWARCDLRGKPLVVAAVKTGMCVHSFIHSDLSVPPPSICLPICIYIYEWICLSIHLPIHPSTYHLSITKSFRARFQCHQVLNSLSLNGNNVRYDKPFLPTPSPLDRRLFFVFFFFSRALFFFFFFFAFICCVAFPTPSLRMCRVAHRRYWLFEGCYKYEIYQAKEWIKPCPSHVMCSGMSMDVSHGVTGWLGELVITPIIITTAHAIFFF